jgi:putative copper resistance protein D
MMVSITLARGLHDASLMVIFGSAFLLTLLSGKVPELAFESRDLMLGRRLAAMLALATAPAWAWHASPDLDWIVHTLAGRVLLGRLMLLVLLVGAVWMDRLRFSAWLSGAALVLIAATGHAAGASPQGFAAIGASNDGLHLLMAGYWIGGLCVLLAMLGSRPSAPRLPQAVTIFAEWGMITVALLVMTGIINAAMVLLGSPGHDNLFYAGILVVKILLVLVMIGLALVNHFRFLPRLAENCIAAKLKHRAGWELGLGVIVVALAGLLTLLAPTHP